MRTGIVMTAGPGVEHLAARAEELGFDSFWVYDSPMVHGDPFVSLALCAKATHRIRLGLGVTSPALRSAPAAAAAISSLNALAPGRVVCGVGTGNTARRTLGMRPARIAELESFTSALRDLTAGRETDYREGARSSRVRFLHVGSYVDVEAPVEFVVAAFGVKAAEVAGRLGAGLISFGLHDPAAWSAIVQARRAAAREAEARRAAPREAEARRAAPREGEAPRADAREAEAPQAATPEEGSGSAGRTRSYLMSSLYVLADGEDRYGDPVKDTMGHMALAALILGAENPAFYAALPPEEAAAVDRLLQLRGTTPTDPRFHQALYRNYLGRPSPEDRELIVPSLVDRFGLVGTRSEIAERIDTLEKAGVDELVVQPVTDDPEAELAALARLLA
ncbi:LLM class flavin-dependent oxidoreductase [Streptomyces silvensis]|uniref:5,10-methylene tetrahydromethanopterin reductase n=1 Tax=Streptomyces silvensis TaxID=1765722 RepID=A0A0W7X5P7_9ACTN|nr:LLM class flavin-dependent oxidoreductase [Streptomyces silvensis]KUF18058.1 5,10-methylene tetrahydromethanopterin reductase [Streptomyces silvensis]